MFSVLIKLSIANSKSYVHYATGDHTCVAAAELGKIKSFMQADRGNHTWKGSGTVQSGNLAPAIWNCGVRGIGASVRERNCGKISNTLFA